MLGLMPSGDLFIDFLLVEFHGFRCYDNIEIDSEASVAYFKNAILIRNRRMVDRSQLVICYIDHKKGGAYTAVQYAKEIGCKVINIVDEW